MTGGTATVSVSVGVLAAPGGLALSCTPGVVLAAWSAVANATGYQVQVLDESGGLLAPQPSIQVDAGLRTATLSGGTLAGKQVVKVQVRGTAPGWAGTWSAARAVTILWLGTPDGMELVYDEPGRTLAVTLQPVSGATGYQVEVQGSRGAPLGTPLLLTVPPYTFSLPQLATGSAYQLRARATAPDAAGAWSAAVPLDLVALAAPTGVAVATTPAGVVVTFQAVPGATGYQAELLDAGGAPLDPPVQAAGAGLSLLLPGHGLTAGKQYQVRVRALWSA